MITKTVEETISNAQFVDADYFVLRVKQFEQKYNQGWGEFLGEYESGRLDTERRNRDYLEWAFLCRTFLSELIKEDGGEPPGDEPSTFSEKPESISGFRFAAGYECSMLNAISSK